MTQALLSVVADLGGTNVRLALADGVRVREDSVRRYSTANHAGLESVLRDFIAGAGGVTPDACCVAVAGPVKNGRAQMTNLDWVITEEELARATGAPRVALLNDLQAQGQALGHIPAERIRVILPFAETDPSETRLVIGVGTGFNAAPVLETAHGRVVPPSESGHVNLPARSAEELRLAEFVARAHGFPAVEDVLSGRGIVATYEWALIEAGRAGTASSQDIMAAIAGGEDPVATHAARAFSRLLGVVAGNLALTQLPFGGIYLVGGLARAFGPHLAAHGFVEGFRDKGRFSDFVGGFGVGVIEDDYAALTGCAAALQALPG